MSNEKPKDFDRIDGRIVHHQRGTVSPYVERLLLGARSLGDALRAEGLTVHSVEVIVHATPTTKPSSAVAILPAPNEV